VACLEFHTKMNSIDDDVMQMISDGCDLVERDFLGMVVGNNDVNFSAGANIRKLLPLCRAGDWPTLGLMVSAFQRVNMRLKYLSRPVVIAPAGLTIGGGCEIAMHGAVCLPCGETYMGLVEAGVGLIPAGGGCKELTLRLTEGIPDGLLEAGLNLQHFYLKALENIAKARVAGSAQEAMELGYVRKAESISMNRDRQLWEAKQAVLGLAPLYKKPRTSFIPVMGEAFRGLAEVVLYNMRQGNYLSDYDVHVAKKAAWVLSGGDCPEGTLIPEQEILDREKEAFLSLCGEPKTQERISYTLETGKPLRN
jgi:3-hydroxyacyl-CoA dehydrogenase